MHRHACKCTFCFCDGLFLCVALFFFCFFFVFLNRSNTSNDIKMIYRVYTRLHIDKIQLSQLLSCRLLLTFLFDKLGMSFFSNKNRTFFFLYFLWKKVQLQQHVTSGTNIEQNMKSHALGVFLVVMLIAYLNSKFEMKMEILNFKLKWKFRILNDFS